MSNEEVIDVLKGIVFNGFDRTTRKERQALHLAIKSLEERPQGEWIVTVDKYNIQTCKCSICGRIEVISHYDFDKIPFCHCGADMRGGAAIQKPNCVRCDHFGKCEGCEKGDEE